MKGRGTQSIDDLRDPEHRAMRVDIAQHLTDLAIQVLNCEVSAISVSKDADIIENEWTGRSFVTVRATVIPRQ